MKKFFKNLTKALCLLFVVSIATISFVGCGNKNNNTNPASNTATSTVGGETTGSAENVNQGEETPEVPEETPEELTLNGIYKLARPITYYDTYWNVSNEEVFTFFETTDINGVYNALRKLDFLEVLNANTYEENDTTYEYMYSFNSEKIRVLVYDGYTYSIIASYDIEFITNNIEIIDESNFIIHSPVVLVDADGEFIETPIFVKIPFVRVSNSNNILTGTIYTYQTGSAKVELSNESTMTEAEAMLAAAQIFDIPTENVDISATLELMFTRFNVQIDELITKATLHDTNDDTFFFAPITNATGVIDGITISLAGRTIDVATGVETINFKIVINENATFTFSYQAI